MLCVHASLNLSLINSALLFPPSHVYGAGYIGLRCESHECDDPDVCGNGTCVQSDVYPFYKCSCHDGYTGETCTEMLDRCAGVDCNNGNCTAVGDSYNCSCYACIP